MISTGSFRICIDVDFFNLINRVCRVRQYNLG